MPAAPPPSRLPDAIAQEPSHTRQRPHARLRLFGLLAVVALTAALPLAGASAGPVDDGPERPAAAGTRAKTPEPAERTSGRGESADGADDADAARSADRTSGGTSDTGGTTGDRPGGADGKAAAGDPAGPESSKPSLLSGLGLTTEAHCGPQLSAPEGIEAQTCVLVQERDTWARTYYRNATGSALNAVLTLMAPGGRTVQLHCAVGAEDEPGMCETPRGRTRGGPEQYAAVAEYASAGEGPLLLRSGSNSAPSRRG
ncbi:hypothetical protein [Streptomyces sp. WG-D5]